MLHGAGPSHVPTLLMILQMAAPCVCLPAHLAHVWPISTVNPLVVQQGVSEHERFPARSTLVGLSAPGVDLFVPQHVGLLPKRLLADFAPERFLARMSSFVDQSVGVLAKCLRAEVAAEGFLPRVPPFVAGNVLPVTAGVGAKATLVNALLPWLCLGWPAVQAALETRRLAALGVNILRTMPPVWCCWEDTANKFKSWCLA
uniref:Putative secreted protein n=1 Tax=Ixodes ricinus TaxID=34613 RepID=A0A147BNX0_IXORI